MKKIKILLIIFIAVAGAILIYKYNYTTQKINTDNLKVSSEYPLLDNNNIFVYRTAEDVANIINNGTGIIFFCIKESEWCQYYIRYLNSVTSANGITQISYLNIKQDRRYNTSGYRKITEALKDYLPTDDEGNKRIYTPNVVFVKNGKVIGFDNETANIFDDITPSEYWTDETIDNFKMRIMSYILEYKEEE